MSNKYAIVLYWLPTFLWMAVIFGFSSQPTLHSSSFDLVDFIIKKTAHFCEYFILASMLTYSLRKSTKFTRTQILFTAFIIGVLYAASDEVHQTFTLGRDGTVRDVLIDSAGALVSVYISKTKFLL